MKILFKNYNSIDMGGGFSRKQKLILDSYRKMRKAKLIKLKNFCNLTMEMHLWYWFGISNFMRFGIRNSSSLNSRISESTRILRYFSSDFHLENHPRWWMHLKVHSSRQTLFGSTPPAQSASWCSKIFRWHTGGRWSSRRPDKKSGRLKKVKNSGKKLFGIVE